MSDLLKSVIQDLINDNPEQAQVSIHEYIVGKTQELAGLNEAKTKGTLFVIVEEGNWDEDYDDGGGESMLDIYEVSAEELAEYDDWEDDQDKLAEALQDGTVGKKTGKQAKVFNKDPDLGVEGNKVKPASVKMLNPSMY